MNDSTHKIRSRVISNDVTLKTRVRKKVYMEHKRQLLNHEFT